MKVKNTYFLSTNYIYVVHRCSILIYFYEHSDLDYFWTLVTNKFNFKCYHRNTKMILMVCCVKWEVCFGKLRYHGMKTKQQSTKKGTGNSNRGVELSLELCNIAINRYSCSYCRHKMNKELGK